MNLEVLGTEVPVVESKGLGKKVWLFLGSAAILAVALVSGVFGMPSSPKGYVTDDAHILMDDRVSIEYRISQYHKQTGVEIAVVTVETLEGQSIEEYANTLFHTWGIGKKGLNNGLLILIAVREHKTRIEVGYGLESKLTDGFCGDVIRDDMVPYFKYREFGIGVHHALTALLKRLGDK